MFDVIDDQEYWFERMWWGSLSESEKHIEREKTRKKRLAIEAKYRNFKPDEDVPF